MTTAFVNARLLDPEGGYDGPGAVLVRDGVIAEVRRLPAFEGLAEDAAVVDCGGQALSPGLIDLRAEVGGGLTALARDAAEGGVATVIAGPGGGLTLDDPAEVAGLLSRGRMLDGARLLPAGALTRGGEGERLAEMGLMREAGAVLFTDGARALADTRLLRRALSYAAHFGAPVAHRPMDPHLARGAVAIESEQAGRLGLPSVPAMAERIGLERDAALVELTGARLIADRIGTEAGVEALTRVRSRGLPVTGSVSIAQLSFNEVDAGGLDSRFRLDPPLGGEDDRQALVAGVVHGALELVVSGHSPVPPERKRTPFREAAPGAATLHAFLPALLALHHEAGAPLLDLLAAVTIRPARLLGLEAGRLAPGAPADLVLFDPGAPVVIPSRGSPFDGRRLQGRVRLTMVGGRIVHRSEA